MERVVLTGKRLALSPPNSLPQFQTGQVSFELETEKDLGIVQYVGREVSDSRLTVNARVYYTGGTQLRIKGQDLVIVDEEDIVAIVTEVEDA